VSTCVSQHGREQVRASRGTTLSPVSLHPKQARDAEDRYFDDSDDSGPEMATTTRMDEDLDY
jgi:hypothetical protein